MLTTVTQTPQQQVFPPLSFTSVVRIPVDFILTLFDPFFSSSKESPKIAPEKVQEVTNPRETSTLTKIGNAIKNHPSDFLFFTEAAINLGLIDPSKIVTVGVLIAQVLRQSQTFYVLADSFKADNILDKLFKLGCYSFVVLSITSVPAAAASALELNTFTIPEPPLGGSCQGRLGGELKDFENCLYKGNKFSDCSSEIPPINYNLRVVTRHDSAFSLVELSNNPFVSSNNVCYHTVLNPNDSVTKTCFNIFQPNARTVTILPGSHSTGSNSTEGFLKPQSSVYFIDLASKFDRCDVMHQESVAIDISGQNTCLFTRPLSGDEVTSVCFNTENPAVIETSYAKDLTLTQQGEVIVLADSQKIIQKEVATSNGESLSIVVTDQTKLKNLP
jgi:hypothetical protein